MNDISSSLTAFHLTGEKHATGLELPEDVILRPALFGAYRDLSKLRYDFPVVLTNEGTGGRFVVSLKEITDRLLQAIAPEGPVGERLRQQVLGIEQTIRELVAGGRKGTLLSLWDAAQRKMVLRTEKAERNTLKTNLALARTALDCDGQVVGFDYELPGRFMTHVWAISQQIKERRLRTRIERLEQKLSDILRVDYMHSDKARTSDSLKQSVGLSDHDMFDFEAMSQILGTTPVGGPLPLKRRRRICAAREVLQSRLKAISADASGEKNRRTLEKKYVFGNCAKALSAYQDRLPETVELVKAISVAELETENRYSEAKHGPYFNRFSEKSLGPDDVAMFPSYLICLSGGIKSAVEQKALFDILSSDLPFKILVQCDEILEELSAGPGQGLPGLSDHRLASLALGLDDAFVLQAGASNLYRLRTLVRRGMASRAPAVFSVFSGAMKTARDSEDENNGVVPYLIAAAAVEGRAFPCYCYDPGAASDWPARFLLDGNPQADKDWPSHELYYEDMECQRGAEKIVFTLVDFAACDRRCAEHFAPVPAAAWHDEMVPVDEFLELDEGEAATRVPYIWMIDQNNNLLRAVVEDRLIAMTQRRLNHWRILQQRGQPAKTDTRTPPGAPQDDLQQKPPAGAGHAQVDQQAEGKAAAAAAAAAPQETAPPLAAAAPGEAYIDTPRCTTCNECTEINNKMFTYNENMQAYIADLEAGTYRQLVEAAETCQVCIIHPGLPKDQNEPGLEDLVARAEPFNS